MNLVSRLLSILQLPTVQSLILPLFIIWMRRKTSTFKPSELWAPLYKTTTQTKSSRSMALVPKSTQNLMLLTVSPWMETSTILKCKASKVWSTFTKILSRSANCMDQQDSASSYKKLLISVKARASNKVNTIKSTTFCSFWPMVRLWMSNKRLTRLSLLQDYLYRLLL